MGVDRRGSLNLFFRRVFRDIDTTLDYASFT